MKKIYEKPKIEIVAYAANTSLCGSCGSHMDSEAIDEIAMIMDLWYITGDYEWSGEYFKEHYAEGNFFSAADPCEDEVFTESFCKFTAGTLVFLS